MECGDASPLSADATCRVVQSADMSAHSKSFAPFALKNKMKTPREILLERHQAVAPKLDAVRHETVAELNNKETKEQSFLPGFVSLFLGCSKNFWRELIFPSRRIWAGLAAVWVLLFIFNFSQRDKTDLMAKNVSPSPEMIVAFRQQEKLLAELMGENEPPIVEPKKILPQPRSERRIEILIT